MEFKNNYNTTKKRTKPEQESFPTGVNDGTVNKIPSKNPKYTKSAKYTLDPKITEQNRGVCLFSHSNEIEQYKILRTRIKNLSAEKGKQIRTIMITSPNHGEGKTVTCINMGFTFAKELNHTVFLVDCDFKGQNIHKFLGINSKLSLIDYFVDNVSLSDLIIWPGIEKLTLISGDRTALNSSELLSSDMMAGLVNEMGTRYNDRYVIFDTPPVLERSETISMAPLMDGIIMVVEAGVTLKKDIQRAMDLLPLNKFLGFVLNKQQ